MYFPKSGSLSRIKNSGDFTATEYYLSMDFLAEAFLEKINAKLAAFRPRPAKGEDEAENSIYNRGPGAKKSDTEGSGLYYSQLQNELKRFYSANPTLKLKGASFTRGPFLRTASI